MKALIVLLMTVTIAAATSGCKRQDSRLSVKDYSFSAEENTKGSSAEEKSDGNFVKSINAATHIGDSATVRGFVADVHIASKVTYLNFENRFPKNVFSCTVFAGSLDKFGDLNAYEGKTVEVSGKISEYKGKPQMILWSEEQIRILK